MAVSIDITCCFYNLFIITVEHTVDDSIHINYIDTAIDVGIAR